ncbi:metallophosphoesterase family protein [Halobacillus sp. HZG1]|nr:metallophosphoesterase family protein [Halobacillus sp. HZG1]MEC3883042.1 metallophosphoesterase family protein [Halobacillus sp. HZG1]
MIYCLGDMIGIGPSSNEVMGTLMEIPHLKMITGNHDEAVLAVVNNEPYPESRINVIPHHEWIADRLDPQYISVLETLPRLINETIGEHFIHFIHYPMKEDLLNVHISKDPFDLTGIPTPSNFSVLDNLNDFSLVSFGHDHSSHKFSSKNKTFFNPGSVGCFDKPYARYGLLDINETDIDIKQKYVPYDFEAYLNQLREIKFPRKDVIMQIYK